MAGVVANKSTNVVSSKKNQVVCDAKSNNALIDIDTITSNNSQLTTSEHDEDKDEDNAVLKNNSKNELNKDEKSLQELIENELALRKYSRTESGSSQPETPNLQNLVTINTDFIEHENICNNGQYPYIYENGNASSGFTDSSHSSENKKPVDLIDADLEDIFSVNAPVDLLTLDNSDEEMILEASKKPEVQDIAAIIEVDMPNTHDIMMNTMLSNCILENNSTEEIRDDTYSTEVVDLLAINDGEKCTLIEVNGGNEEHQLVDELLDLQQLPEFDVDTTEVPELLCKSSQISSNVDIFGPLLAPNDNSELNNAGDVFTSTEMEKITVQANTIAKDLLEQRDDEQFVLSSDSLADAHFINSIGQMKQDIVHPRESSENNMDAECHHQSVSVDSVDEANMKSVNPITTNDTNNSTTKIGNTSVCETSMQYPLILADQLPIPDDEIDKDLSDMCDSESREEVITTSSTVTLTSTKNVTKTKKKKIEGVVGNDVLPANTPRTKKTKKSKKSDLEKENISVNINTEDPSMQANSRRAYHKSDDISNEDDLSNVNVKSLTQCYALETTRYGEPDIKCHKEVIETGVSIKQLKSSFNKFDALTKKSVLDVRSNDTGKVEQQLNVTSQNGDANTNCRSCGKVVFQMEQTKAEGLIWHKNCFRCIQCSKQLTVDNYSSHESTLYCKPHFKELFQPKPVDESNQPVCPRKPEMIIRENQPKELPPDVVRASDKPDLGLEELSSLNVKSRFQVFEKSGIEVITDIERSPSQISVKRSPSILSKLAKFQAKGMDIGVADDSLNGIPFEESSESEEEQEIDEIQETDLEIIKSKRTTRERPMSFSKMDDMKNRWEVTSQQGRRESQREARKEEIAGIRSRLFMGKQGKMKEMYQQAVATSEQSISKINPADEIQCSTLARSIKERFERGEPIALSDDESNSKPKQETPDEEVIAAGISRKSRSLFLEMDASAAKTGALPVTLVNPKSTTETPRRARDVFMGRQVSEDVVRSTDATEQVQVDSSDISNKFKFFETYKEPEKCRKQFRITPPRDGQVKMNSPEREIYRDPDVIRADDRVDQVVHTDTTKKMLSIFRQMEEKATKEDLPDGPKPLKRFTPPPEDKYARPTASDSEEEEAEDGAESGVDDSTGEEEKNPNYVRASDKMEDDFLKHAQNAAKAKTLRAKFEHWDETDSKTSTSHNIAEMEMAQTASDEQSSMESARSLRARFESLGSQPAESPRTPKVKVNRFVDIQTVSTDVCESCQKKVYPLEKVETNNKIFHKQCFRCLQCNCVLRMDTFTLNNGKLYCIPHFKQLFITRGNYDEGFGVDPHKNKWTSNATNTSPTNTATPIVVANGATD